MHTRTLRGMISLASLLLVGLAWCKPLALTDAQLDTVFAAGFDVKVDMKMDLSSSNPGAVLVDGSNATMQQLAEKGLTVAHSVVGGRNSSSLDPGGAYMPNLQNLTTSSINLGSGALQNSTSLMNIFALDGDLNVGLNFNIVINPLYSPMTIMQTNVNGGVLSLSNAVTSLNPIGD